MLEFIWILVCWFSVYIFSLLYNYIPLSSCAIFSRLIHQRSKWFKRKVNNYPTTTIESGTDFTVCGEKGSSFPLLLYFGHRAKISPQEAKNRQNMPARASYLSATTFVKSQRTLVNIIFLSGAINALLDSTDWELSIRQIVT